MYVSECLIPDKLRKNMTLVNKNSVHYVNYDVLVKGVSETENPRELSKQTPIF